MNDSEYKRNTLQRYLFEYEGKLQISPHFSLTSTCFLYIWRMFSFIVLTIRLFILLQQSQTSFFRCFQYLSYLGFTITWLYLSLICLDILLSNTEGSIESRNLHEWIWILFELAWCLQYPITIVFWMILFNPLVHFSSKKKYNKAINLILEIGIHGFPLFSLIVDFIFNTYQFPLRHLTVIIIFGCLYLTLNAIYSLDVKPIYKPINWKTLGSYLLVLISFLIAIGVHRLGNYVWVKCRKVRIEEQLNQEMLQQIQ